MSEVGYNHRFFSEQVALTGRELPKSGVSCSIRLKDELGHIDCQVESRAISYPFQFKTPHGESSWKYTSRRRLKLAVEKVAKCHGFRVLYWEFVPGLYRVRRLCHGD
jgi:hypothetical protein